MFLILLHVVFKFTQSHIIVLSKLKYFAFFCRHIQGHHKMLKLNLRTFSLMRQLLTFDWYQMDCVVGGLLFAVMQTEN